METLNPTLCIFKTLVRCPYHEGPSVEATAFKVINWGTARAEVEIQGARRSASKSPTASDRGEVGQMERAPTEAERLHHGRRLFTGKWVMGVPIHPSSRALSLAACQAWAITSWSSVSVRRLTMSCG